MGQYTDAVAGVCYPTCVPFQGDPCAQDECLTLTFTLEEGYCMEVGTAAIGATCTPTSLNTGCVEGGVCGNVGDSGNPDYRCIELCDFFGTTTAVCTAGESCQLGGECADDTYADVDGAAIGAACAGTEYVPCGVDANRVAQGICSNTYTDPTYTCTKWCRLGSNADCDSGETCEDVGWDSAGVTGMGECH